MTKLKLSLGLAAVVAAAALAGVGATAVSAKTPDCATYPTTQPFVPWLDLGSYFLMPGGSFENGASGWTLSGGAKVVAGNEPYDVGGANDSHSLSLPAGSTAAAPSICVSLLSPDLRLFVLNSGSPLSLLRVDMTYTNLLGKQATTTVVFCPEGRTGRSACRC